MDNKLTLITKLCCLFLFMLIFSACQHKISQDGPPHFYVDETKIPDAVPKFEPLAKYGNMNSYRVFGKRYYVMHSNLNYDAVGTASWYGTKFHKRRTSSGEVYNLLGMTAAHKTLPLPTYVEVINLKNNRKVVVKVNDRGPFHSNRLIDLSYIAAKKLGMVGHGTTLVRVRSLSPGLANKPLRFAKQQTLTPAPLPSLRSGRGDAPKKPFFYPSIWKPNTQFVYLQVGAFRDRSNAMRLQHRLYSLLKSPVKIVRPSLSSRLYRVHIGPIRDLRTADRISKQLKGLGIAYNKQSGIAK